MIIIKNKDQKTLLKLDRQSLCGCVLSDTNLQGADLKGADLRGVDLKGADLQHADLKWANLQQADLKWANLGAADLKDVNLQQADLTDTNLQYANLQYAILSNAKLCYTNLQYADLLGANLQYANLQHAMLYYSNLIDTDLSQCHGILSASDWLKNNFQKVEEGYIVFKNVGDNIFTSQTDGKIDGQTEIIEEVDSNRTNPYGCGVHFGTLDFIKTQYPESVVWNCLLSWENLADVVVPYNTIGNARCRKLKPVKIIKTV